MAVHYGKEEKDMKKIIFYSMLIFVLMPGVNAAMVDAFMDACEKGSMQGCYQTGVVYWTGEGAKKDVETGRALLEIACDGGFDDACVALRSLMEEEKSAQLTTKSMGNHKYTGHIDGKLYADIDGDGKEEIIVWKKFAAVDLGDYYQLLVIDDDESLLWEGPKKKDYENPLVFFSLDFGVSMPELLIDFDYDGYVELLAPAPQSDVSPTYYRKLRWRGTYFEPLLSNALMLSSQGSNQFIWKRTSKSYGTWISALTPYNDNFVKVNVTDYNKDEGVRTGVALIRFNREGAVVYKWIKSIPAPSDVNTHRVKPHIKHRVIGTVYGLDPYGDGFLSIRKKPNSTEMGKLYNGDKVEILGKSGKWYKIKDPRTGRIGWSHNNWIRIY